MKLSIFTPTHRPKGLKECWESITSQVDGLDVEWIVVPNGTARQFGLGLPKDDRILIRPASGAIKGVGALKAFAVAQCNGDMFIELDHDDILLPGCLDAICAGLDGKENAFFYSATSLLHEDGRPFLHPAKFGWEWDEGKTYNKSFPADWRSLCEIFYAPNHVRAWTRGAYDKAGGYNSYLEVCDDHDLIIRTYLAGAEFVMDDRPLYEQRMHGQNTQSERNKEIQKKQAELRDKNLHSLAREWCRREGLLMVDLGGAFGCPKNQGWLSLDAHELVDEHGGEHVVTDLEKGIPLESGSVGFVRAVDFLEHVHQPSVVHVMNEIHRVLAPGGLFYSLTPSTDGRGAFQDPTHVSFWNSNSFFYYTRQQQARYVPDITARFQKVGMMNGVFGEFNKLHNIVHVEATLAALHGQRQPGLIDFPR